MVGSGAGAWDPSHVPVLCFWAQNRGEGGRPKEGDDIGGPSVSETKKDDDVVACGLAAWAACDQARPACSCAWANRGGRKPDRGCWAAIAIGELDQGGRGSELGLLRAGGPRRWMGHKLGQMAFPFSSSISFLFLFLFPIF